MKQPGCPSVWGSRIWGDLQSPSPRPRPLGLQAHLSPGPRLRCVDEGATAPKGDRTPHPTGPRGHRPVAGRRQDPRLSARCPVRARVGPSSRPGCAWTCVRLCPPGRRAPARGLAPDLGQHEPGERRGPQRRGHIRGHGAAAGAPLAALGEHEDERRVKAFSRPPILPGRRFFPERCQLGEAGTVPRHLPSPRLRLHADLGP